MDKNIDGDYLVSARYSNCIYKVSASDGSIVWQLGGWNSSFVLDFNFSSQHDARFREENSTTTIISFLNNASDGMHRTSAYSSALLVALHTSTIPMTANVITRWDRPDRQLSHLRGNMQILPNTNIFVGWSSNGYMTEFTADGHNVLEASFASERYTTYRAYKFNFTGHPSELPSLASYVYGVSSHTATTTIYVSWNGATEVTSWNFYGSNQSAELVLLGNAKRSGFETMFMYTGYIACVYGEALAVDGRSLGNSSVQATIVPLSWKAKECIDGYCGTLTIEADTSPSTITSTNIGLLSALFAFVSLCLITCYRWRRYMKPVFVYRVLR